MAHDTIEETKRKILSSMRTISPSPLLSAAIQGKSDQHIAVETAKRLEEKLKREGRDTFTMAELREVRSGVIGQ